MSDHDPKYDSLAVRQGGLALSGQPDSETLPEGYVESGRIEVRGDESARVSQVSLSDEQFAQLTLSVLAAVKPSDAPVRATLGELIGDWLLVIAPRRVSPGNEKRLARHLLPLFLEDEDTLTVEMIARHLESLTHLSNSTINKARGVGRLAIDHAMGARRWSAPNPFAFVKRLKQPRRQYELLNLGELAKVQAKLRPDRRRLFRVALHTGMRTGELLALQRADVNFEKLTIHVHRSHDREQTKTGSERVVPLVPAIAGDMIEALQVSTSELVFGDESGERQRADVKLTRTLRKAMADAGVGLTEVEYICRRCADRWRQPGPPIETPCPKCSQLTLKLPLVRPVRWYDLRHMCATLHHAAGADPLAVALALGHSVKGTTQGVYTHPSNEFMMRELSKWKLPG